MSSSDKNNSDFTIESILSSGKDFSESIEFINFTVQNAAGKIVSINVSVNESFKSVQERIQNQCGIPLSKQIFSCFDESTLWNGNDGMQQTFNDLNEIRVNVKEMKDDSQNNKDQQKIDELSNQITELTKEVAELIAQSTICTIKDLENKYEKAQQRIDELEAKIAENETQKNQIKVNYGSNGQIVEQKDLEQESETAVCQISNQIAKLTKANAEFVDPSRICTIKDVFINGKIDYELLNGKILEVDFLIYCEYKQKWFAHDIEISFENSDFLIYPKVILDVGSHSNLSTKIINRIVCNNLKSLSLWDITITYSDYKKLTTSQKLGILTLWGVNVMDENGKKIRMDKLLKEKKYVKDLTYKFNDGEVTSETAQKFAELPPFPNLHRFTLLNVLDGFDLKTFGEFLKKNPSIVDCELKYICSDKCYKEVQRAQNDLMPTLPSKCKVSVEQY